MAATSLMMTSSRDPRRNGLAWRTSQPRLLVSTVYTAGQRRELPAAIPMPARQEMRALAVVTVPRAVPAVPGRGKPPPTAATAP
jgi:hypothetical protein